MATEQHHAVQYIDSLVYSAINSPKYPHEYGLKFAKKELGEIEINGRVDLFRKLCQKTGKPWEGIIRWAAKQYIKEAAVDDLIKYCKSIGCGTYTARKDDLENALVGWDPKDPKDTELGFFSSLMDIEIVLKSSPFVIVRPALADNVSDTPSDDLAESSSIEEDGWNKKLDISTLMESYSSDFD